MEKVWVEEFSIEFISSFNHFFLLTMDLVKIVEFVRVFVEDFPIRKST